MEAEISKIGPFTFSGNFTYIDALLDYYQEGPVEPIPVSSALPFQPEYIANFTLTHEYEPWDLTTNLVYNFTGEYPSILKREPDDSEVGRQDITTFDLIIAKAMEINEADYTFRIGVKNLLGAEDTYIYNGRTFSSDDLGRTYYFEAEVSF
jgi:outer membrane receptor protein involved in Fe transport